MGRARRKGMMAREPNKADNLDRQIDENLRRLFHEKLEEGVPERFEQLLRKLREQDRKK